MSAELEAMRAERARLDAAIAKREEVERRSWNALLDDCEDALGRWVALNHIDRDTSTRKNWIVWAIGHGALSVHFGYDDKRPDWGRGFQLVSGKTLTLEWSEVPEPDRFIAIVAALLGINPLAREIIKEVSGWSRDPLDTDSLIADWTQRAGGKS